MKKNVHDISGTALDYAVAVCEQLIRDNETTYDADLLYDCKGVDRLLSKYTPSTYWMYGGPIIEREHILLQHYGAGLPEIKWEARKTDVNYYLDCHLGSNPVFAKGPTMLVAAMRCYVVSKCGKEIEIPDGLL